MLPITIDWVRSNRERCESLLLFSDDLFMNSAETRYYATDSWNTDMHEHKALQRIGEKSAANYDEVYCLHS